jgi:hypothetical protein
MKELDKHIRRHVETREVCGVDGCTVMPTNTGLKAHRESHTPKTKPAEKPDPAYQCAMVECNLCHNKVQLDDLEAHKETGCVGSSDKRVACGICGHKLQSRHMPRHMLTAHTGVEEILGFARSNFPEEANVYGDIFTRLRQRF